MPALCIIPGDNEEKLILRQATEWVRTSDPGDQMSSTLPLDYDAT